MQKSTVKIKPSDITEDDYHKETNELLNKICDTFHEELKWLGYKYGTLYLSIKTVDEE